MGMHKSSASLLFQLERHRLASHKALKNEPETNSNMEQRCLVPFVAGVSGDGMAPLIHQNLRDSAKATYSSLRRWGEWLRDGPTYTSLSIQILLYYLVDSGEMPL
eukprot:2244467-Pleurochrysis_carterae.AAC.1